MFFYGRGLGALVFIYLLVTTAAVYFLGGRYIDNGLYFSLSLLLAAIPTWFTGIKLNRDGNVHTLYGIPMQYWAFILIVLGIISMIATFAQR